MTDVTLDEADRAVLERLASGTGDVATLADGTPCSLERLAERLPELADNGLVERRDDEYALTDDGRRVLAATARGRLGDRFDIPPAVDGAVEDLDLRPDAASAVRSAFAFLRFWGTAFPGEVVDAVYSEHDAGFDDAGAWWHDCVRDGLAALPSAHPPIEGDGQWRYDGTPTVSEGADGRDVMGVETASRNDPRFALERLSVPPETVTALRATFARLVECGSVDADDLAALYDDRETGEPSLAEWIGTVRSAFDRLPGVERVDEDDVWRYRSPEQCSSRRSRRRPGGTPAGSGRD